MHRLGDLKIWSTSRGCRGSRASRRWPNGWQSKKQGILLVAKITDGDHVGMHHVYDGGTRRRLGLQTVGADYEMPCWVEDMTEAQAAEKFDIFNSESKKPTAYDHYKVGHCVRRALPDGDQARAGPPRPRRRRDVELRRWRAG